MIIKKMSAMILALLLMTQIVQARNNAALFGVAAAAIAGAAIIANSNKAPQRHYEPRHRNHSKKKHRKKVAITITDEMKIQQSLTYLEFYGGKIDGKINSYATRNAIKKMNERYGINSGTTLGQKTWDQLLYLSELFEMDKDLFAEGNKKSTKGKRLQTALKVYGTYDGKVDGIVGNGTRKSIAKYKKREGLTLTTSLTSNERYNLIDSAQKMNAESINEAITNLSPTTRKSPEPKATPQSIAPEVTKPVVAEESSRVAPTASEVSIPTGNSKPKVKQSENSSDSDQKDLDEMQKALDSIDNDTTN